MKSRAHHAFEDYCLKCYYRGLSGCAGYGMCHERFAAGADWSCKDSIATVEDVMCKAQGDREYVQGGTMGQRIIDALKDDK